MKNKNTFTHRFNKNIKELRKSFSFNQEQMAEELDIPLHSYISYERTKGAALPKADTMKVITNYFNLSYEEIMYSTNIVRIQYENAHNLGKTSESILKKENEELVEKLADCKEKNDLLKELLETYKKGK